LAIRAIGGLMLLMAPFCMVMWIVLRWKMRHIQVQTGGISNDVRQLPWYRIALFMLALLFVVSLLPWVGLIRAVRFDWSPNDVSEIEILQFATPYAQVSAERSIHITDGPTMARLLDALKLLQPYYSNHEHPVGKSYILRLRRQSDGQWSRYRVRLYPDRQAVDASRMRGVHVVHLDVGTDTLSLGDYQATELGWIVEEIAQRR
jgi:hypothetical protein